MEACGVPVLIDLTCTLSDIAQLYGRWAGAATREAKRDVEQEHRDILAAVLKRDAPSAAKLLRRHYETTMDAVRKAGEVGLEKTIGTVPAGA
jgi:DNA-binding GntR family transcriptional regulator